MKSNDLAKKANALKDELGMERKLNWDELSMMQCFKVIVALVCVWFLSMVFLVMLFCKVGYSKSCEKL